mmetsp:Transcript_18404/g.27813  ORF Transcript_18404/g.27813 Transcript_18404/m.27813 type:complete len:114 (-) Transcript_18404:180-521(-)
MKPAEEEMFYPSVVKRISKEVTEKHLAGKEYDEDATKEWVVAIADEIKNRCKEELNMPRYKIIVQVTVGQVKDQGVRVCSRCLWDTSVDNYASTNFENESIWCSTMVFGLYTE